MLTYFKDGVYTEKVIGDAQPSEDSAVKGIPRDLFDTLSEKQRDNLLNAIPSGRLGSVEDVASVAVFLASDEASYVTGQTLHVNGGMAMT